MLILPQYLFFLVLTAVTIADPSNWFRMKTLYGFITLDGDGWTKPITDEGETPILFQESTPESSMGTYITIMSGSYKGQYLGWEISNDRRRIRAQQNLDNTFFFQWKGCILEPYINWLSPLSMVYSPKGNFEFRSEPKYEKVCVTKEYPNRSKSCNATNVTGGWKYVTTLAGKTTCSLTHGTAKTYTESKTTDWSYSVSSTVEASLKIMGIAEVRTTISAEYRRGVSKEYSREWASSKEEAWGIEFGEKHEGKALWQFLFNITDSCHHNEITRVQEYAITTNKETPPCCLPGYSVGDISYSNCTSEDTLIENDKRCHVAVAKRVKSLQ